MRIKKSVRGGLTFSFQANEKFQVGKHYRYVVDTNNQEIVLLADEEGKYKFSHKGVHARPLVDLRNQEIRNAMSLAAYMEVEVLDDKIVVRIIKKDVSIDNLADRDIIDMLDKETDVSFAVSKEDLVQHDSALVDMLTAAGMFSQKTQDDLSYVFDTVSLFSGAGLLDWPFKNDGSFDIKFAVDFDKSACETYRQNIGNHILCMDIRDLMEEQVPDADLIIGGPCCQGYSNANRAGNTAQDVSKRLLIDDYIRMVKAKQPMMFLIENVEQFITKEKGKYLEKVLTELSDNYNVTYSVVNDWELGGYSKRKRMILIGSIKEMGNVIIPNVELVSKKTVRDALSRVTADWYNYNDVTNPSPSTVAKMQQVPQGGNYKNIKGMETLDRHSCVYRRLAWDAPSVTITNWRKANLTHPEKNRILTVSEAAAIMGLDKRFKFFGSLNDKQQQVGNGVTQAIATFAKSIIKTHLYAFANKKLGLKVMEEKAKEAITAVNNIPKEWTQLSLFDGITV